MAKKFCSVVVIMFALLTIALPAHAIFIPITELIPDAAVENVNIGFAGGLTLTGEIAWDYFYVAGSNVGAYGFPQPGPTGLYIDGNPPLNFGCGEPGGDNYCSLFAGIPSGPYNISAALADLPNNLIYSDFIINGSPGISGTVNCVDGCDGPTATPLPAALPLFGSSVLGLAGFAWKQRAAPNVRPKA